MVGQDMYSRASWPMGPLSHMEDRIRSVRPCPRARCRSGSARSNGWDSEGETELPMLIPAETKDLFVFVIGTWSLRGR